MINAIISSIGSMGTINYCPVCGGDEITYTDSSSDLIDDYYQCNDCDTKLIINFVRGEDEEECS